ncbi:MAG: hypothetical protein OXB99_06900 [Acidimicrobiaceae bacterium]|nr:hypothetical protein [Acidimicrobiaceae bacterium]
MQIRQLEAFTFPVPFKRVFKHASASRRNAENLIVAAHSAEGTTGYGEGCPRLYVTGETVHGCAAFVRRHAESFCADVGSVDDLWAWADAHRGIIDLNPAAFCAMEIAALDLLGKAHGRNLEQLLGVASGPPDVAYSAVLGDMPLPLYRWQLRGYWARGFTDYKVKLSGSLRRDRAKLAPFASRGSGSTSVRLDANNLWESPEQCAEHLDALGDVAFAIEEPLQAGDIEGCVRIARDCEVRIIADESLRTSQQLQTLTEPQRWIANVRVSKMGGVLRSLEVVAAVARAGIDVIVGCQVGETSLLTRAALAVIASAPGAVIAAEGAFGTHLLSRDLTDPTIMFGYGGVLRGRDVPDRSNGGLGLRLGPENLLEPAAGP